MNEHTPSPSQLRDSILETAEKAVGVAKKHLESTGYKTPLIGGCVPICVADLALKFQRARDKVDRIKREQQSL